jgi:hypothetical protein
MPDHPHRSILCPVQRDNTEQWDHSFLVRVEKRARELHLEILGKEPKKQRPSTIGGYRNKVGMYPCGILEQAYRQVRAKEVTKENGEAVHT